MQVFLILLYVTITLVTGILLFLIIKYLQDKPFGRQFVTDHLSVYLSIAIFATNSFLSTAIILREIIGPFQGWIPKAIMIGQQFLNLSVLMCLLSMQLAQVCNVFFIDRCSICFYDRCHIF
jgi:hypothetical protein